MLNRKERTMLNMQRKYHALFPRIASVIVLSVSFVAPGAISASANDGAAPQSKVNAQFVVSTRHTASSRKPRYFGYAGPDRVFVPDKSVPDDGCDLPSTGCPNYLAN